MNKKFFAALASATMAFTASGSIAVFADDFVEENTPSIDAGDLKPVATEVVWNEENFGDLASITDASKFNGLPSGVTLKKDEKVKTDALAKVTSIDFTSTNLDGEIKGLEYFAGLTSFTDANAKLSNETLDFSANTALKSLTLTNAKELAEIKLPEADEDEVYHLETLDLQGTKLTALDLSKQEELTDLTVNDSKLNKLDLSELALDSVTANTNYNLKEVVLNNGRKGKDTKFTKVDLQNNALETVNLDYTEIGTLNLNGNHIGALDLSKTTATTATLGTQTFYVSETLKNVNLKEAISGLKLSKVTATDYDAETGVLTLSTTGLATNYTYKVDLAGKKTANMTVTLTAANPMNRLYNPNSGEHFYTADIKEKEALVALGWNDEGFGWVAKETPAENQKANYAVYRLYNPNAGDHHYTMSKDEVKTLVAYGWKDEGTGWYSTMTKGATTTGKNVEVYRQYNPYANGAGSHNYTTDKAENDYLVSLGWTPEGTAWHAYR